ncbi:vitamin K-dependent gamma-carboxylase [Aplysia californica]|uniref:Vitamin K-dependent gamma-carboxylase n=1 Tax=Aplysia californica TaxID=6500 RepID=A0ABM0ZUI2_APLCA|nr:vitamin K-dependent gamma-carboxylase [Aplysia californica]
MVRKRTGTTPATSPGDRTEDKHGEGQSHRSSESAHAPMSFFRKSTRRSDCKDELAAGEKTDSFCALFGFAWRDLTSANRLVRLLCRPSDPASLGTMRFLYGFLMVLDIFQERGLATADGRWGDKEECRFPLFNFLKPLPLQWMYIVYLVMLAGALGIMLGFMFRMSCLLYLGPYWYLFFLDKTSWNNHSYLFGILAFLFSISDANRYWSVDALLNPKIHNRHIPLWNYTLLRAQIFLLYFIAGLKKLDLDWVSGYSMQNISHHWVFDPLKLLLTDDQIDMYVVHLGGLTIDLFLGFLLFFDKTRPLGLLVSSSFHLMNSQIFSIGMFPYACIATQFLFCYGDWPRRLFRLVPPALRLFTPDDLELQPSGHCVYNKEDVMSENVSPTSKTQYVSSSEALPTEPKLKQKIATLFTLLFIAWQCFLPYSHGITKGYNNWTNGLYGYSWDMMVHSWYIQHVRITYYDKDTGQSGYLDPLVWGGNRRWSSHADMIKQYSLCIAENLKSYNINNVEIYFDIWRSLNHRFQQRTVHPHVDIVTAEWSPFREAPWVMPLMVGLSDWRGKLEEIQARLDNGTDSHVEVVFVADFPGLYLENYVQPDFGNTSLSVLDGRVIVELLDEGRNISLGPGDIVQIPPDTFHNVHTVSETPSCYMYMFVNTTEVNFMRKFSQFEDDLNSSSSVNETLKKYDDDPYLVHYQNILAAKQAKELKEYNFWLQFKSFLLAKYKILRRSIRISTGAVYCLATNNSFNDYLNSIYQLELRPDDGATTSEIH